MRFNPVLGLFILLFSLSSFAEVERDFGYDMVELELYKNNFKSLDISLYPEAALQVLSDLRDNKSQKVKIDSDFSDLNFNQRLELYSLHSRGRVDIDHMLLARLIFNQITNGIREKEVLKVVSLKKYLPEDILTQTAMIYTDLYNQYSYLTDNKFFATTEQIKDAYDQELGQGLQVYVFCRRDRNYPCRLIVKGQDFSVPVLAKSTRELESQVRNGQTPQGVHLIRSVMPQANRQRVFGEYRRVILNFAETDEMTKDLLPQSSHDADWWKKATVSRDVGRQFLRIHGTGLVSSRDNIFYPHVSTSGCISTREGTYDGVTYRDQRQVLDHFMMELGLKPVYANETKVVGTLFLFELDDEKRKVEEADLAFLKE